jgi:hypothetical protein
VSTCATNSASLAMRTTTHHCAPHRRRGWHWVTGNYRGASGSLPAIDRLGHPCHIAAAGLVPCSVAVRLAGHNAIATALRCNARDPKRPLTLPGIT